MPPKVKVEEPKKKHKSGYCMIGSCEGTKPKSASGQPMKTCDFIESCSCDCHILITKMFEIAEQPRQIMSNPEYMPVKSPFWMPTLEEVVRDRAARSHPAGTSTPPALKSPAPGTVPPVVAHSFGPTPTGRAARGELEDWINAVCGIWLVEKYPWDCTPVYIAAQIAKREGIAPPSTGAITAAFERWKDLGFAVVAKKPIRFVNYTPEGVKLGLDVMKEQAKRERRKVRDTVAKGLGR